MDPVAALAATSWLIFAIMVVWCCGFTPYIWKTCKLMTCLTLLVLSAAAFMFMYNAVSGGPDVNFTDFLKQRREL